MKIYGIALIGCGRMGGVHLDDIYCRDNVSIACVCDTNVKSAEFFKKKYNAKSIETDAEKCVNRPDVDIVIIATYPSTHTKLIELCFKYGKHVICEKPIAINKEDKEKFIELVNKYPNCKIISGHILRHNETYKKAAEMIQGDMIGHPIIMRLVQNHHTLVWEKYLNLIKESSSLIDCGVHYIDIMQWFSGEKIKSVSAIGARTENDIPEDNYNYSLSTVKLDGGTIGYLEVGWTNTISAAVENEFVGPKGRIKIIHSTNRSSNREEGDLIEYYKYPEKEYVQINVRSKARPTGAQLEHLIDIIENKVEQSPSINEICENLDVLFEADRQIREGLKLS